MDVKSHITNGIAHSCIMTVCVLLVMSPASHQIVKVGSNTPAPALDFDMPLGARANMQPAIKTTDTSSSGNSHLHTDNGNSGQIKIKLDAKQQKSGSNIKLDEINQLETGEKEMAHSEVSRGGAKATKRTQCGKSRKTVLVESKAMAAAGGCQHGWQNAADGEKQAGCCCQGAGHTGADKGLGRYHSGNKMLQASQARAGGGPGYGGCGHKRCGQDAADGGERTGRCSKDADLTRAGHSSIRKHARD